MIFTLKIIGCASLVVISVFVISNGVHTESLKQKAARIIVEGCDNE